MDYSVVMSGEAEKDIDGFIYYLLYEKKNEQAARNLLCWMISRRQRKAYLKSLGD